MVYQQHNHRTPSWCCDAGRGTDECVENTSRKTEKRSSSPEGWDCWCVSHRSRVRTGPYLDGAVERRSILLLEAGSDVQHVHLAPRHHDPHQGSVISSGALRNILNRRSCCRWRLWIPNSKTPCLFRVWILTYCSFKQTQLTQNMCFCMKAPTLIDLYRHSAKKPGTLLTHFTAERRHQALWVKLIFCHVNLHWFLLSSVISCCTSS